MSEKQISMFQASKPISMTHEDLGEMLNRYCPSIWSSPQWSRHTITIHVVARKGENKKEVLVSELTMSASAQLAADPEKT